MTRYPYFETGNFVISNEKIHKGLHVKTTNLCITNTKSLFQIDMTKDALFRGEFEVVKELMAAFPDGDASKRECDKVSYH